MLKKLVDNIYDNLPYLAKHNYVGIDIGDIRVKLSRGWMVMLSTSNGESFWHNGTGGSISIRNNNRSPIRFNWTSTQSSNKKVKYLWKKIYLIKQKVYKLDIIKKLGIQLDMLNYKDSELYNKILEKVSVQRLGINYSDDEVYIRLGSWGYSYPLKFMFNNLSLDKIIYDIFYSYLKSFGLTDKEDVNWFIKYTINEDEFDNLPKHLKKLISSTGKLRTARLDPSTQIIQGNGFYVKLPKSKWVGFGKLINDSITETNNRIENISSEIFERIPDVAASDE